MGVKIEARVNMTSAFSSIEVAQKKIKRNLKSAEEKAAFRLWDLARKSISRSGKDVFITRPAKLFTPRGEVIPNLTLDQFLKGKKITRGRMKGRTQFNPKREVRYRWTPKRGRRTHSFKNNPTAGFREWLVHQVRTTIQNDAVILYANPTGSKNGRFLATSLFEYGGSVPWKRRLHVGYYVETLSHAIVKGHGKQRAHRRKIKNPGVSLRKFWLKESGVKAIAPAPFLAPALSKFMTKYFDRIYNEVVDNLK